MSNFYGATSITGGGSGALDAIDGADLSDLDGAVVITDGTAYFYHLNATSGEGESSPDIISPDSNPGTKRWILEDVYGAGAVAFTDLTDVDEASIESADIGKVVKVGADLKLEFAEESVAVEILLSFTPQCNEPPASNFATFDTRNNHPVLDFDDTTNESAVFRGIMPNHYTGNGVTVVLHYAMTSAEANTVDWDVAFERIGDQQLDIDGDSFAEVNSVDNTTVPGTSGLVDIVSIAFTDGADMDSIAAGEGFRLKVTRDASSDDASGDAELLFVEIKETP